MPFGHTSEEGISEAIPAPHPDSTRQANITITVFINSPPGNMPAHKITPDPAYPYALRQLDGFKVCATLFSGEKSGSFWTSWVQKEQDGSV
jgi:hypothetical protein